MKRTELKEGLDALCQELESVEERARKMLDELQKVAAAHDSDSGLNSVRHRLEDWRESHPDLTAVINRVSDLLAQLGI